MKLMLKNSQLQTETVCELRGEGNSALMTLWNDFVRFDPDMLQWKSRIIVHGPKYGTVLLSTTHKVRSPTGPTEGVANSYSHLNRPIKHVPILYLMHCNL